MTAVAYDNLGSAWIGVRGFGAWVRGMWNRVVKFNGLGDNFEPQPPNLEPQSEIWGPNHKTSNPNPKTFQESIFCD